MDQVSSPTASQRRGASTEPASIRPRSADEDDASSRKRRRTSVAESPGADSSLEASFHVDTDSNAMIGEEYRSANSSNIDGSEATIPHTPDQQRDTQNLAATTSVDPPSSRVTINLRHPTNTISIPSSPESPSPNQGTHLLTTKDALEDHSQPGYRQGGSESSQQRGSTKSTDNGSSASGSPPVEVMNDLGEDENMRSIRDVQLIPDGTWNEDPTCQFPFQEAGEPLERGVIRVVQYMRNQPTIEESVLVELNDWFGLFLRFSEGVDQNSLLSSCEANRRFWAAIPHILFELGTRRSVFASMPTLHDLAKDLYSKFFEVTVLLIDLDSHIVADFLSRSSKASQSQPILFSKEYLLQVHEMVRWPEPSEQMKSTAADWSARIRERTFSMREFLANFDSTLDTVSQLTHKLVQIVSDIPKMSEYLVPMIQILADIMHELCIRATNDAHDETQAKDRLRLGHELWSTLSASLQGTIDKNITSLNAESTGVQIRSLSELLKFCLNGEHQAAVDAKSNQKELFPQVSSTYRPAAVAWQWQFDVLDRLIRSSQMQLRLMAVSVMCSELVKAWQRLGAVGDVESLDFQSHIANYLLRSGLVDYVLSGNCHPEIIPESHNIIGCLLVSKTFSIQHNDRLWLGITSTQNPRVAEALARMVNPIQDLFDNEWLADTCGRLKSLPLEAFTPAVRVIFDAVFYQIISRRVDHPTLTVELYELCIRLVRDISVAGPSAQSDLPSLAVNKLREFLGLCLDDGLRSLLYDDCIRDIAGLSHTSLGSLWCLFLATRTSTNADIRILYESYDLPKVIVYELDHAISSASATGVSSVLAIDFAQPRKEFITHLLLYESASLADELGLQMWNLLVGASSLSQADRNVGWQIISAVSRQSFMHNPFLKTCFSQYLSNLPAELFCEAMHSFIRDQLLLMINTQVDPLLGDENVTEAMGLEHLWRIILSTDDQALANLAIHTLAIDVHIKGNSTTDSSAQRRNRAHLALVNRCLQQLKEAARWLQDSSEGETNSEDDSMVVIPIESQVVQQKRVFARSLHLLRYFVDAHQANPSFSAPDLRLLMSESPHEIQGDLAQLKYQSYDGFDQTEMKPLPIGKLNTAASLLASLKQETGFENYSVYYRGQQFLPREADISKSLQDLHIDEGLILVKREDGEIPRSFRIRPGCSPLQIEILSHYTELVAYLSMEEALAKEIHDFIITLPADGHIMDFFEAESLSYRALFPLRQPYKTLHALHAFSQYVNMAAQTVSIAGTTDTPAVFGPRTYPHALRRVMHYLGQAIRDEDFAAEASHDLQMKLTEALMDDFVRTIRETHVNQPPSQPWDFDAPPPSRFISIWSKAIAVTDGNADPLIFSTFCAILHLSLLDGAFWAEVKANTGFLELLRVVSLFDRRKAVREKISKIIEKTVDIETALISEAGPKPVLDAAPSSLSGDLWKMLWESMRYVADAPSQSYEYFISLQTLMVKLSKRKLPTPDLDLQVVAARTSELLIHHTSTENLGELEPHDPIADGLASSLLSSLDIDQAVASSPSLPDDLAQILLWRHLFPGNRVESDLPISPVILNTETRKKVCDIISKLIEQDDTRLKRTLEFLKDLVPFYNHPNDDPYHYELPFSFDRLKAIRSPTGYVGLRNLSNTCYLNSLLTQLFMNPSFRRFILSSDIGSPETSQALLFQTQKLFAYMQGSCDRFVDPTEFVERIKTYDDTVIDVNNQMDVDEFYSLLFDRWESQLSGATAKTELRSFYGGKLVQQVKSLECEHISERLEPFAAIQCDIKGKANLEESLQAYVDGDLMEGDNKYKCSTCDRHVDAVKRTCLKDIPDNLIFHLKRFDFNLRLLQRSKINDWFAFPAKIDLQPYTVEHLSDPSKHSKPDLFELVGILVHSGTAESGHYYSYIRERPTAPGRSSWFEFNDDIVTAWDPSQMEACAFGGPTGPIDSSHYEVNVNPLPKPYSAYMLFYQRVSTVQLQQEYMSQHGLSAPLRITVGPELTESITHANNILLRRHCLFDPSHVLFLQDCFHHATRLDRKGADASLEAWEEIHGLRDLAMEVMMGHLDQVVTRTKDLPSFGSFSTIIYDAVTDCGKSALRCFEYFQNRPEAFRSILQRNPDQTVRIFAGQMLVACAKTISDEFPAIYLPDEGGMSVDSDNMALALKQPVLVGILDLFAYLWQFFHINIRSWDEYFGAILAFARLGGRETSQVLAHGWLLKLLHIVSADEVLDLPSNYARMLQNVTRRMNTRLPPSYVSIIDAIDYLLRQLAPVLDTEVITDESIDRLEYSQKPFPWSSEEVDAVHMMADRHRISHFVEKLLAIGHNERATLSIVERLIRTGKHMETRISATLRKNLQGATSTTPMDPYMKAASVFVRFTKAMRDARDMIQLVCDQAKHLQNTESECFLRFMEKARTCRRSDEDYPGELRDFVVGLIPEWACYLLLNSSAAVRIEAESLLCSWLFTDPNPRSLSQAGPTAEVSPCPDEQVSEPGDEGDKMTNDRTVELRREVVQRLGVACLEYLRDAHVRHRVPIHSAVVSSIIRTIRRCYDHLRYQDEVCDDGNDDGDDDGIGGLDEFRTLREQVIPSLERLIVDEVDENGSDWNGSGASSESAHDIAELTMEIWNGLNDTGPA